MKTFNFYQKNSNVCVTLSAENFDEAEEILFDHVKSDYGWRCDDEDDWDEDHNSSLMYGVDNNQ